MSNERLESVSPLIAASQSSLNSISSGHSRESCGSMAVTSRRESNHRRQGTYWIGTISCNANPAFEPGLIRGVIYLRGQRERGDGGFEHWQLFCIVRPKQSLSGMHRLWQPIRGHWELTRSAAAEDYVWKEDSRIGDPFEFGERPFRRNESTDWDRVRVSAHAGNFEEIPSDVYIRYYSALCRIRADNLRPPAMVRTGSVFWGPTGTGKSRRAWAEAGDDAYCKDPRSKFWCGYRGEPNVIVDEFRGAIDISHILRWLDRYPCRVETKGGSYPLLAVKFWFTSNIPPTEWFPDIDFRTQDALLRRLDVVEMNQTYTE